MTRQKPVPVQTAIEGDKEYTGNVRGIVILQVRPTEEQQFPPGCIAYMGYPDTKTAIEDLLTHLKVTFRAHNMDIVVVPLDAPYPN
jgi:hypothetical protein